MPAAAAARAWALAFTRRHGSRLLLLHVRPEATPFHPDHAAAVQPDDRAGARQRLRAEVPTEARAGLAVEEEILAGWPQREIVRFARERRADLIVIGSEGTDLLGYPMLGSTAERVVRQAPCAVPVPGRAVADRPAGSAGHPAAASA